MPNFHYEKCPFHGTPKGIMCDACQREGRYIWATENWEKSNYYIASDKTIKEITRAAALSTEEIKNVNPN